MAERIFTATRLAPEDRAALGVLARLHGRSLASEMRIALRAHIAAAIVDSERSPNEHDPVEGGPGRAEPRAEVADARAP